MSTRTEEEILRKKILTVAARHLWMAMPVELEDYIVSFVMGNIATDDLGDSANGVLSAIIAECAWGYHAGMLDLTDHEPYGQLPAYDGDMPMLDVMGPHDTWIRIDHAEACGYRCEGSDEDFEQELRERQRLGYCYLR